MSSWCLVAQLPRTLPRGAPHSLSALARCRRCACSQSDLACAQPHGAPSGRATVFQNKCSRNAKAKKSWCNVVSARWCDRVRLWFDWI